MVTSETELGTLSQGFNGEMLLFIPFGSEWCDLLISEGNSNLLEFDLLLRETDRHYKTWINQQKKRSRDVNCLDWW